MLKHRETKQSEPKASLGSFQTIFFPKWEWGGMEEEGVNDDSSDKMTLFH